MLDELNRNIIGWAEDRNIIDGSTPQAQLGKLVEEMGELATDINKGRDVKDSLGDMFVVISIIAEQYNLDLDTCVLHAWNDIKDRKGRVVKGVFIKEADL